MNRTIFVGETRDILNPNSVTFDERIDQLAAMDKAEKEAKRREKQSTYKRWAQYNLAETKRMMGLALSHPKAHAVLLFLVDQMDAHNAVICSHEALQELLGIAESTVKRAIKVLKDGQFITVLKSGKSNVYAINDTVYWKSWGKNLRYSKFDAAVVVTDSEQQKSFRFSEPLPETEKSRKFAERYERITSTKIKHVDMKAQSMPPNVTMKE